MWQWIYNREKNTTKMLPPGLKWCIRTTVFRMINFREKALQAVLAIRGFDYSRIHFCIHKFVIRGFSLDYLRIFKQSVSPI